jgi:type VI protein secretion system component VasK
MVRILIVVWIFLHIWETKRLQEMTENIAQNSKKTIKKRQQRKQDITETLGRLEVRRKSWIIWLKVLLSSSCRHSCQLVVVIHD